MLPNFYFVETSNDLEEQTLFDGSIPLLTIQNPDFILDNEIFKYLQDLNKKQRLFFRFRDIYWRLNEYQTLSKYDYVMADFLESIEDFKSAAVIGFHNLGVNSGFIANYVTLRLDTPRVFCVENDKQIVLNTCSAYKHNCMAELYSILPTNKKQAPYSGKLTPLNKVVDSATELVKNNHAVIRLEYGIVSNHLVTEDNNIFFLESSRGNIGAEIAVASISHIPDFEPGIDIPGSVLESVKLCSNQIYVSYDSKMQRTIESAAERQNLETCVIESYRFGKNTILVSWFSPQI